MGDISAMLTSKSNEWETPQDFFNQLDSEFHFNLDPCSNDSNYKCENHYTIRENGLEMSWGGYNVFCNPPYGKSIKKWVRKAYLESQKPDTLVVMLIPSRTDTLWFHDYILGKAEVRFLKGRLRFSDSKEKAPFPSMVVVFRNRI